MECELNATSKTIAAIPEDKKSYAPAPNSRTAWQLAVHIVTSEAWFLNGIVEGTFNFTGEPLDPVKTVADLVPWYKQQVTGVLAKLREMTPQQLTKPVGRSRQADPEGTASCGHRSRHRGLTSRTYGCREWRNLA